MRKALSVGLYVVAGFFFYTVSLVAFFTVPSPTAKCLLIVGISVPAVLALGAGLAIGRFRNWMRDAGTVLLSAAGFSVAVIFTFTCLLMNRELRQMMPPSILTSFGDYLTGTAVIVTLIAGGVLLVMGSNSKDRSEPAPR